MPERPVETLSEVARMTPSEFIAELEKVRSSFQWLLAPDSYHTPERRAKTRLHIRAMHKQVVGLLEPMGALCYALTGHAYGAHAWAEAAKALNISEADAWEIMAACDDLTWRHSGGSRRPHREIQSIRKQILAALRLEVSALR